MGMHASEKKHLSAKAMLSRIRAVFETIPESTVVRWGWRRQQSIFTELYVASWEDLYRWMVDKSHVGVTMYDMS